MQDTPVTSIDAPSPGCTTRSYTLDLNSNRTGQSTYNPGAAGACQTTTPASSATHSYDTADRSTDSGYIYDGLGRTTATPASAGGASASYHANDLARSLTAGGVTKTWQLDPTGQRFRSWTGSGDPNPKTNHYSGDGDSPDWTAETASTWTRNIDGITGDIAAIHSSATGSTTLHLANLHGDLVATATTAATAGLPLVAWRHRFEV